MRLFGCVCGQFHSSGAGMGMAGGERRGAAPVPFYVIEHPDGVTLFDCGLPTSLAEPEDRLLAALRSQGLDVTFAPDETVASHLQRLDIDPARVRQVVVSHLHFDHVGGLHQVPNATVVVQRAEWEAGFDEELAARYFLRRKLFDLGHEVQLVDGEHDLFGDGRVVCIPTPGHTPGHQSVRVRSALGDHILVGDACYNGEAAQTRQFPEFADQAAMNRSLDDLLARREAGTVMVFGHDPGQWGEKALLPSARA